MPETFPHDIPQSPVGARVTAVREGVVTVDAPVSFTNGYHIRVWWEDETWYAQLTGGGWGGALADGATKQDALLELCCALAATCDAIDSRGDRNG